MRFILQKKVALMLFVALAGSLIVLQSCKSEENEELPEEAEVNMSDTSAPPSQPERAPAPEPEPEPEPEPPSESEPETGRSQLNTSLFDESGPFTVQVAAHRNRYMAENVVEEWRNSGFENAFIDLEGNEETGDIWYKVNVGRYASYDDAKRMAGDMEQAYDVNTWPRRISYP